MPASASRQQRGDIDKYSTACDYDDGRQGYSQPHLVIRSKTLDPESTSTSAVFNVKAVAHATGVSPDTLRAWERRYGMPSPSRTGGRHRLYSSADVELLRWLVSRQREGMSISRAVDLWRRTGGVGLPGIAPGTGASAHAPTSTRERDLGVLREEWITASLAFDESEAEATLTEAFALYPVELVCAELLQSGIARIGELWFSGNVTPHQEHFAASLATRQVSRLIAAAPNPYRDEKVLLGCPAGEHHVFGVQLLTLALRRRGFRCVYLGADVPLPGFGQAIDDVQPDLIVLAAQQLHTAAALLVTAREVTAFGSPLGFGGSVFNRLPALQSRIPGYFLGPTLSEASRAAEAMLLQPPPVPAAIPDDQECQAALAQFDTRRVHIESVLATRRSSDLADLGDLADANVRMARGIRAGLTLGNLAMLDTDLHWVMQLLALRGVPSGAVSTYLARYADACERVLDAQCAPIVEWVRHAASDAANAEPGAVRAGA